MEQRDIMFDQPLADFEADEANGFVARHIGLEHAEIDEICRFLNTPSLDSFIDQIVPSVIRSESRLDLPASRSEANVVAELERMASCNNLPVSMIGQGYHDCITPVVLQRNLFENPGWYTAYTPYQAEVSQGRLEALTNFQQMVCDLTGMELANASLLDEATAAAEAMTMARRLSRVKGQTFVVERDVHPQTLAVLRTRARPLGIHIVVAGIQDMDAAEEVFGALLSYPGSSGAIYDIGDVIKKLHARNVIVAVATDLLALTLLTPPGELDADIVLGSAQRFGVPMGYGGPHAAFFACRDAYKRAMPGRIIGVSVDREGRPALRMALQTREQHIRRDKATSNICTSQVLLAVIAGMYAVYHGANGLHRIALRTHKYACILAAAVRRSGLNVVNNHFFDTVKIRVPDQARRIADRALEQGYAIRVLDDDHISLSFDETTDRAQLTDIVSILTEGLNAGEDELEEAVGSALPLSLRRKSAFLSHPVYQRYSSETEMMRYLRRLQAKDIALDRSMIPLGSCTMKLNAAAEMLPVSFSGFAKPHPYLDINLVPGYQELFEKLNNQLCAITGFDAVSLQPNAGSQGEYAGLLTIRAYQDHNQEGHRSICLIPASAHGTNPASAILAGLKVVVVPDDPDGNIDVEALRQLAERHKDELSALMVTYPSTHGVFEEAIKEICAIVHEAGGQVYMDGANLNALVGLSKPAEIGADVCHINLHKTFCIPHGGGGPGMGPIGVKQHLAAFLPGHPVGTGDNPQAADGDARAVSAAPYGSASILPISYGYIAMMGAEGLTFATKTAILAANYIARRLSPHYPIVFTGLGGHVAHECIIDLRDIKSASGITVEDVAKRLIDYGFHAPTMSWPVPDSMMIEPSESESKAEIDRFCDAMIAIRDEIREVEHDRISREDSPLHHAPHHSDLLMQDWHRPYSREQAFYPMPQLRHDKYWPPVARVDNVHGDRNLVCSCPPMEDYQNAAE